MKVKTGSQNLVEIPAQWCTGTGLRYTTLVVILEIYRHSNTSLYYVIVLRHSTTSRYYVIVLRHTITS